MYLLDTNICIYFIKERPSLVVDRVKAHQPYEIKISAITVAELEYGVQKSRDPEKNSNVLVKFLSSFEILPFDDIDAEAYGRIRAHLERSGQLIGPLDMQIAAQGVSKNLVVVTNNIREFMRVPRIELQDWSAQ
jgi:tRNA(fMet)-specific endonuclease VapC